MAGQTEQELRIQLAAVIFLICILNDLVEQF